MLAPKKIYFFLAVAFYIIAPAHPVSAAIPVNLPGKQGTLICADQENSGKALGIVNKKRQIAIFVGDRTQVFLKAGSSSSAGSAMEVRTFLKKIRATRRSANVLCSRSIQTKGGAAFPKRIFSTDSILCLRADFNGDGVVNMSDLSLLMANFGSSNATFDLNGDGKVGIADLIIFLDVYGQTCTQSSSSSMTSAISSSSQSSVISSSSRSSTSSSISSQSSSSSSTTSSASGNCQNTTSTWQNISFSPQNGSFSVEFDATPASSNGIDSVLGASSWPGNTYSDFAAMIRFSSSGLVDVRTGSSYGADSVLAYSAGVTYHIRMLIDITNHIYSVYARPLGASETTLATNYNFRTEQSSVSTLSNFGYIAEQGSLRVCNVSITQISVPTPTPTPTPGAGGGTTASISQYGVTFTFDKAYPYGQFANGDYWVVGPLVIISMSPDASNGGNGFMVNPLSTTDQSYDSRAIHYTGAPPALPLVVQPNSSVIKTISSTGNSKSYLSTGVVLTVVGSNPVNNGTTAFRPPYFGPPSNKTIYSTSTLHTERLPTITMPAGAPSLATIMARAQMPQLFHQIEWYGDQVHPTQNFGLQDPYGALISSNNSEAILRLMGPEVASDSTKRAAIINYVQAGIDVYGIFRYAMQTGQPLWEANGGHDQGMLVLGAFAATMLDDPQMKADLSNAPDRAFAETDYLHWSSDGQHALFGINVCGSGLANYFNDLIAMSSKTCTDPLGFIDGGTPNTSSYQYGNVSQPVLGNALVIDLMSTVNSIFGQVYHGSDRVLDYAHRWHDFGFLTMPDPCAPNGGSGQDANQGGGPDPLHPERCILDPDIQNVPTTSAALDIFWQHPLNFTCIPGRRCGRFPLSNNTQANGGFDGSSLVAALWLIYEPN